MVKTKPSKNDLLVRSKRGARWLARSSLPELLFIGAFILGRYLANIDFSYPEELVFPFVVFGVLVSVVFYVYKLVLKSVFAAHLASLPFTYILYGFRYFLDSSDKALRAVLPGSLETELTRSLLLAIVLAIVCGITGYLIATVLNRVEILRSLQLPKILVFAITFLFLSQTLKVTARLWSLRYELSYQYNTTIPTQDPAKVVGKPDIYYLVFDRYGNNDTLKNIYNYDNTDLTDFLSQKGFVTREQAYANYAFTMSSISSTLSMQYHTDLGKRFGEGNFHSAFPYRTILNEPPVATILKQNGYVYNQVSSWWDFTRVGIKADNNPTKSFRFNIFGMRFYLSDLDRDILYKSFLSPLFKQGLSLGSWPLIKYDLDNNPRQNFEDQMAALKDIAARPDKTTPQFTFAHVLVPHDPYIFTADGLEPIYDSARTDNGVDETVKYTNQVSYLNKRIKDLISNIRQQSPNAAIVIQADEGPYPKEFRFPLSPERYYNPADLALPQMRQKFSVLASYYMPDTDKELVSQNITASVNPFRFILSRYLGYSLDMLPNCNFATGDKFSIYKYQLMNAKLTDQPIPAACASL